MGPGRPAHGTLVSTVPTTSTTNQDIPHDSTSHPKDRGLLSAQWKPGYHGPACQGPLHSSEDFAKDQALQAWRPSRGFFPTRGILQAWRASRGISPREGPLLERTFWTPSAILLRTKPKARRGFPASRGFPSPRRKLCLRDRAHMGSAPSAESWARLRSVTAASQLPFSCIKQSIKRRQAKEP